MNMGTSAHRTVNAARTSVAVVSDLPATSVPVPLLAANVITTITAARRNVLEESVSVVIKGEFASIPLTVAGAYTAIPVNVRSVVVAETTTNPMLTVVEQF